ncbi:Limonene 1,2-monooxygenase [Hartmannibacter diazotrophicus]|uniref:Limonene 1,2-monooxygenase n=1 Tax=Hartmannibacter diazotrophicus TaxID=1482074 RepID=A0A2C9D5S6_9HYPH|nr:MsnO8 family LLM class oxidoreductase [Hartmannibacter diazotrophicus]SON55667.1 Limonene 1,2-monooxygenase [Hartmannibacter diazotrophicus]
MRLSVLDQSILASGRSAADAIRETLALAKSCETFGYHRFWVSEHHGYPGLAGSAPEVLLGAVAAATSSIRIGSAATILAHVSPLKAAEQAFVLGALAPGRVDIGLGRGPGADRATIYALRPEAMDDPLAVIGFDRFGNEAADVVELLGSGSFAGGHPFAGVRAVPGPEEGSEGPEPWIVGGTPRTARLAGQLGLPYAFAHFVADGAGGEETVEAYRAAFVPSRYRRTPYLAVSAFAAAAPTEAEADGLYRSYAWWRSARDKGRFVAIDPVGQAGKDPATEPDRPVDRKFFGTAETVLASLEALAGHYGADEIVVQAPVHNFRARVRSLKLMAEAAGLGARRQSSIPPETYLSGAGLSPTRLMEPSR